MNKFETSTRAASQFFAAFIGFSLKHILDARPDTAIGENRFFFLCVSVFLFLRFFFGSANHLWLVYGVEQERQRLRYPNLHFVKDLLFLTGFGIMAAMICSKDEISAFFQW